MDRQIVDEARTVLMKRRSPKWWRVLSVFVVALAFGAMMRATLLFAAPASAHTAANLEQSVPDHGGEGEDNGKGGGKHHDETFIRYGVVVTRPDGGNEGTWVIRKTEESTYTVTSETDIEQALPEGTCVKVESRQSDPTVAVKIREADDHRCVPGDDDDHDDHDNDSGRRIVAFGLVGSRPDGKIGTWVIGGESYSSTERTDLDHDHGRLVPGVCAKVKTLASNPTVALEIESKSDYACERDGSNNAKAVLFGLIEELPLDVTNGVWLIGGKSFVVSPTTEIVTKGIPLTVGLTVKVQFSTDVDETNYARRIEVKFGHNNPCHRFDAASAMAAHDGHGDDHGKDHNKGHGKDHDDDDHHRFYGYCPGHEGRAVGIIDDRPEGTLLGDWVIGGVPYLVNAHTHFHGDDFLQGERVKVEYVVLSDTLRLATKIKQSDDNGGVSNPNASLIVGFVVTKPVEFIGWWNINGALFEAVSETIFIERGSLFAVGAYVVVDYEIVDDRRLIHKILTYVPPGAGDDNQVGTLQSVGGAMAASVEGVLQNDQVWTIDGVEYIVSEATQLVDSGGALVAGALVHVNSYTENGQRYATMIRTQGGKAFIPMAAR